MAIADAIIAWMAHLPTVSSLAMFALALAAVGGYLATWYMRRLNLYRIAPAEDYLYLAVGLGGLPLVLFYAVVVILDAHAPTEAAIVRPLSRLTTAGFLVALIINSPLYRSLIADGVVWIRRKLSR